MTASEPNIRQLLSPAIEDYLKNIYQVEQKYGIVNTTTLADKLNISAASATNMIKKLSTLNLVDYRSHRGVTLTQAGEKVALEIIRHHRLLELYLSEILGYSWDEVHDEAEKLEHHISEQFEDAISEMLGHPKFDPHGDPIPGKDGKLPEMKSDLLSDSEAGKEYKISRIEEQSPEFLRYISDLGLKPGAIFKLLKKEPFNGPLLIVSDGKEVLIGFNSAKKVHVAEKN